MKRAIVYSTDGGDAWRLNRSLFCIRKYLDCDVFVLYRQCNRDTLDSSVDDFGQTYVEISEQYETATFFPDRWNRRWPYDMLGRLLVPIVPELDGYSRCVTMDTDVLVLRSDFGTVFDVDMHGYETVGAGLDPYGAAFSEADRAYESLSRDAYMDLDSNLWARNPLQSHVHFNEGLVLWDMDRIRGDREWFLKRLAYFWEAECRGKFYNLTEDFVNIMMDSSAILHPRYNYRPRFMRGIPEIRDVYAFHYQGMCNGENSEFVKRAESEGYNARSK